MNLIEKIKQYAATLKSDFEASLDFLADDVVWINLLPDNVPFGGEYVGKPEAVRYFMLMAETFELGSYLWDDFHYIESGNELVIVGFEITLLRINNRKYYMMLAFNHSEAS